MGGGGSARRWPRFPDQRLFSGESPEYSNGMNATLDRTILSPKGRPSVPVRDIRAAVRKVAAIVAETAGKTTAAPVLKKIEKIPAFKRSA
jgi:hypothetical protein